VDTGGWVALAVVDDRHHRQAAAAFPRLLRQRRLITTNLVIAETYTLLRREVGHQAATRFLDLMENSPRIRTVFSTRELEGEAGVILRKFADQTFSYVDAVSFAVMRAMGIGEALAFDVHFRTMGFTIVP
jgi:predicted nucleic acid-binding protein